MAGSPTVTVRLTEDQVRLLIEMLGSQAFSGIETARRVVDCHDRLSEALRHPEAPPGRSPDA